MQNKEHNLFISSFEEKEQIQLKQYKDFKDIGKNFSRIQEDLTLEILGN